MIFIIERSTTIESIAIEKYYSEEASRVALIREMKGILYMVIVYRIMI